MVANQYQLWDFSFVARIHRNIDLVRNNVTGQLMIRRISPSGDFPVLQALCGIKHRNLMEVYDLRLQDGVCVSLCEYINGITLAFRVENGQLFDVKSAKRILCQICDGLTALHSRGIVHRDIKPENIMITNDGTAKIIDYSICRLTKPNQRKDTTVLGTAGYASPEQFGFAQTSATADIYACGVLLNYLLTGKLPNEELHQGALKPVIEQCIEIDYDSEDNIPASDLFRVYSKWAKANNEYEMSSKKFFREISKKLPDKGRSSKGIFYRSIHFTEYADDLTGIRQYQWQTYNN